MACSDAFAPVSIKAMARAECINWAAKAPPVENAKRTSQRFNWPTSSLMVAVVLHLYIVEKKHVWEPPVPGNPAMSPADTICKQTMIYGQNELLIYSSYSSSSSSSSSSLVMMILVNCLTIIIITMIGIM